MEAGAQWIKHWDKLEFTKTNTWTFPDYVLASTGSYSHIHIRVSWWVPVCVVAEAAFWCSLFGQSTCLCSGLQEGGAGYAGKVPRPIPLQGSWRHSQCFANWMWGGCFSLGSLSRGEEHKEVLCRDFTIPWPLQEEGPVLPFNLGSFREALTFFLSSSWAEVGLFPWVNALVGIEVQMVQVLVTAVTTCCETKAQLGTATEPKPIMWKSNTWANSGWGRRRVWDLKISTLLLISLEKVN